MSKSSQIKRPFNARGDSLPPNGDIDVPRVRKRIISPNDAYLSALRVAYLAYLLQPRARRTQHVPAPPKAAQRSTLSLQDLMKDFSLLRDSKSTKFPHGFIAELEKRLTMVIMGKEKTPEYNDAAIKRAFAAFFNALTEQGFKKRMEKDRRVEDLVLIFFSNATRELQKGKPPSDDSWKLMVDRHVALFIRLISLVLKDHEWSRDRPELTSRLSTLESKLLAHDQDLAADLGGGGVGGSTIEVIVPLSYDVKDMLLVQVVARIFGLTNAQVQSDIDKNKVSWTARAALQDLKTYQTLLNLNSWKTLRSDDFDLEDGYEAWKKAEAQALSQMMLAIVQSHPDLPKNTNFHHVLQYSSATGSSDACDSGQYATPRKMSDVSEGSSHAVDQHMDMNAISPIENSASIFKDDDTFTFVPSDPRDFYRFILSQALSHDLKENTLLNSEAALDQPAVQLLSRQSTELLNEIAVRWRIHYVSRIVLFLDVVRENFMEGEVSLDTLDAAFTYIKEPLPENKKDSEYLNNLLFDRTRWTLMDFALNQQILTALHDALLRDLYDITMKCYEPKPPSVGAIMYVLQHHVYDDPGFPESSIAEFGDAFTNQLREGLREKAFAIYKENLENYLPQDQESWEFYHIIALGKAVVALAQRIQKRYRKNPEIMGQVLVTAEAYPC